MSVSVERSAGHVMSSGEAGPAVSEKLLSSVLERLGGGPRPGHTRDTGTGTAASGTSNGILAAMTPACRAVVTSAVEGNWALLPCCLDLTCFRGAEDTDQLKKYLAALLVERRFQAAYSVCIILGGVRKELAADDILIDVISVATTQQPNTRVPPQLLLRKANVLIMSGDLHGAMKQLQTLLEEDVDSFPYSKPEDCQHVKARCDKLLGYIFNKLCCWKDAIAPFVKAVAMFERLNPPNTPEVIETTNAICMCLMKVTLDDYNDVKELFVSPSDHHCHQAFTLAKQAAARAANSMDALQFMQSKNSAAEALLMYVLARCRGFQQQEMLNDVLREIREGLDYWRTTSSCQSPQFLFEITRLVFTASTALANSARAADRAFAAGLEAISVILFSHYCRSQEEPDTAPDPGVLCPLNEALAAFNLPPVGCCLHSQQTILKQFTAMALQSQVCVGGRVEVGLPIDPKQYGIPILNIPSEIFRKALGCKFDPTSITLCGKPNKCRETVDKNDNLPALVDTDAYTVCVSYTTAPTHETDTGYPGPHFVAAVRPPAVADPDASTVDSSVSEDSQSSEGLQLYGAVNNFTAANDSGQLLLERIVPGKGQLEPLGSAGEDGTGSSSQPSVSTDSALGQSEDDAEMSMVGELQAKLRLTSAANGLAAHRARVYKYNPVTGLWQAYRTLAYVGEPLALCKEAEGCCRDAFFVRYSHQDEILGRYVGKRYRCQKSPEHYLGDIICHKVARFLTTMFNYAVQEFDLGVYVQYVPVAHLQLLNDSGELHDWINIEPYIEGAFTKLTNNLAYCNPRTNQVATALSHYTYCQSEGKLMLVDLQGWLPDKKSGVIYLTDPQFHSTMGGRLCSGDLGARGMNTFWGKVHPTCNDICMKLKLERPWSRL